MNTERLAELAGFLFTADRNLGMQQELERLRSHLDTLASSPGHEPSQIHVAEAVRGLEEMVRELAGQLTPARMQAIIDIGGEPYFTQALPAGIRTLLAENAMTPSVVRDRVVDLLQQRQSYLTTLDEARRSLKTLGAADDAQPPGSAEIGFLLPRDLFGNKLKGLAAQFGELDRILAVFSEVTTGAVEPAEVHQLSTTDPLIFLGLPVATVATVGAAIKWGLESWKTALEIKQHLDQAKALKMPDAVLDSTREYLETTIQQAIKAHTEEILASAQLKDEGRKNELRNGVTWALQSIMEKIEAGVTVEIRVLPPPNGVAVDATEAAAFEQAGEIAKQLEFPKLTGEPVMVLTDRRKAAE